MHFYCEGCCRKKIECSQAEVTEKGEEHPCWRYSPPCKCCRQIYEFDYPKSDIDFKKCVPDPNEWICDECASDCNGAGGGSKCKNMRVLRISDDSWVAGSGKYMNPWWL